MSMSMKKMLLAAGCLMTFLAVGIPMNAAAGDAKKGKAVFTENCSMCHNATSTEALVGPGLKGLFKRAKLATGKPVSDATVLGTINKGGETMPPFADSLKAAEKDDVLAYLKTL